MKHAKYMARAFPRYFQQAFDIEKEIQHLTSKPKEVDSDSINLIHKILFGIKQQLELVAFDSLSEIRLDDVVRMRAICRRFLTAAQTVETIHEGKTMGKLQIEKHIKRDLMVSDCRLLSGCIYLLIASVARQDMELHSADVLRSISEALKNVLEVCLTPENRLWKFAAKKHVDALLLTYEQILRLLTTLASDIGLPETMLIKFEASMFLVLLADNLVENIALDKLRGAALCFTIEIFHRYPTQRSSIVNEILIALKGVSAFLPNSPRFKLPDGGNISLISALIMRVVQSTVGGSGETEMNGPNQHLAIESVSTYDALETCENPIIRPSPKKGDGNEKPTAIQLLAAVASPLLDTATETALQIVASIVNGALCSIKASPCNPLYVFTEDLLKALVHPEWPAAELLLRLLLFQTVRVLQSDKTAPMVKLVAIDVLGLMGQAISRLNFDFQILATAIPDDCLNNLIAWKGSFHVSLAYLQSRKSVDPQASSAARYLTAQWALKVITIHGSTRDTDQLHAAKECDSVAERLQRMAINNAGLPADLVFCCAGTRNIGSAYRLILLHSRFCESFRRMLHNLLLLARDSQVSIRCRSLKALLSILEADHSIIDHTPILKTLVSRSINDASVSVREYSLRLICSCIELKPELELEMMPDILRGVLDQTIAIRKRAIKILKGIYLRSHEMDIKTGVARTLLRRVEDLDQTVREVVYKTIEEIWILPFYQEVSTFKTTPPFRPPLIDHLTLISNSIRRDHHMVQRFITALQAILAAAKSTASLQVFALFVAQIFDMVVHNSAADGNGLMDRGAMFQLLAIFARTNASVFTTKQIRILQPYISKVDTKEDMAIYRSTISVLYHALPLLPNVGIICLRSIKNNLIRHISRVSRPVLNEVIPCLRAISEILQDNKPLTSLTISCLENIQKMESVDLQDPAAHEAVQKTMRLLNIAGMCGKHCNFEAELESFRMRCAGWSGNSIAEFMISTFTLFSSSRQPISVREAALDAICMVCYSWPENFTSAMVHRQFKEVFEKDENSLLEIVLKSFKEFFIAIEKHSEVYEGGRNKLRDVAESG
jgi:cohesin loading factor subunit SCC2